MMPCQHAFPYTYSAMIPRNGASSWLLAMMPCHDAFARSGSLAMTLGHDDLPRHICPSVLPQCLASMAGHDGWPL